MSDERKAQLEATLETVEERIKVYQQLKDQGYVLTSETLEEARDRLRAKIDAADTDALKTEFRNRLNEIRQKIQEFKDSKSLTVQDYLDSLEWERDYYSQYLNSDNAQYRDEIESILSTINQEIADLKERYGVSLSVQDYLDSLEWEKDYYSQYVDSASG